MKLNQQLKGIIDSVHMHLSPEVNNVNAFRQPLKHLQWLPCKVQRVTSVTFSSFIGLRQHAEPKPCPRTTPARPLVAIVGGAKINDKPPSQLTYFQGSDGEHFFEDVKLLDIVKCRLQLFG